MRVLITGGGGFIGSHAVVETLEAGHEVVVIDDCSNVAPPKDGKQFPPSLERVRMIVGNKAAANLRYEVDCRYLYIISEYKFSPGLRNR